MVRLTWQNLASPNEGYATRRDSIDIMDQVALITSQNLSAREKRYAFPGLRKWTRRAPRALFVRATEVPGTEWRETLMTFYRSAPWRSCLFAIKFGGPERSSANVAINSHATTTRPLLAVTPRLASVEILNWITTTTTAVRKEKEKNPGNIYIYIYMCKMKITITYDILLFSKSIPRQRKI